VVDAGALDAVVSTLRAHVASERVVEEGCRALGSLVAFFPAGQLAAVVAQAPEAIATHAPYL
jgi:hypothetical protein